MGSPFVGEIRMFGGNLAPAGWAFCNGALMPIAENEVLFNLIGTTYGGDGQTTFALPDLQGRLPIHQGTAATGTNYVIGEKAGTETVTLTVQQIANHNHQIGARTAGNASSPAGAVWGGGADTIYNNTSGPTTAAAATMIGSGGGSQPHDNMMPYLCVSFIISLFGIFPSQN